jgi:lipopolysaccharide transport system ATP-binding protein
MTQLEKKPSKAPILTLENVGINYGRTFFLRSAKKKEHWVLRNLSFELYQGESLGVLGRNGIGKSTLLRTMAGIMRPDEGKVKLRKGATSSLLSLGVGFLPELTGRENIVMSCLLQGMPKQEIYRVMDSIIDYAEIREHIDKPISAYSSGMSARLGFAISLQCRPDILLLDEVLGVGDVAFRKKSAETMREYIQGDQTVVLVSHNGKTIQELCTRVIWIQDGKIHREGSPDIVVPEYEESMLNQKKAG